MDSSFLPTGDVLTDEERSLARRLRSVQRRLDKTDRMCEWFWGIFVLGGITSWVALRFVIAMPSAVAADLTIFCFLASFVLGLVIAPPLNRWRTRTARAALLDEARQLARDPHLASLTGKLEAIRALSQRHWQYRIPLEDERIGPLLHEARQRA